MTMIVCTTDNKPLPKEDLEALETFKAFRVARNRMKNNKQAWSYVEEYRKAHNGELPPLPDKDTNAS